MSHESEGDSSYKQSPGHQANIGTAVEKRYLSHSGDFKENWQEIALFGAVTLE